MSIDKSSCSEIPNSSDIVSRQAVLDLWDKYRPYIATKAIEFDYELRQLPSAEPKRGKWIKADVCGNTTSWECSCCHNWTGLPTGWNVKAKLWFCPKCTADMRGVTE